MRETPESGRKRFDLNVPQVAGGALAAVVAAKLASYFGVYGTIFGAGVVSVIATCGGSLFQQFFRRTGQQIREAAVTARSAEQGGTGQEPSAPGEFTEGTVYRARVKSWKRPLLAAALVFGITMTGITVYELASGNSFSGDTGTTVSDAVGGKTSHPSKSHAPAPSWSPSDTPGSGGAPTGHTGTERSVTPAPSGSPSGTPDSGAAPTATATPTPSATTAAPTSPEPSASSGSGTAVPGQGGPVVP